MKLENIEKKTKSIVFEYRRFQAEHFESHVELADIFCHVAHGAT